MFPTALTASPHRCPGSALSIIRHRVISRSERFLLSATPLRSGVYGGGSSREIPFKEQIFEKAFEVYSPPLSVRRVFTFCHVDVSTRCTKC